MIIKKETKIKGLKTESIIALMVFAVVLVMTICSTIMGYSFKMDTAKAEEEIEPQGIEILPDSVTDLSGTIWKFNDNINKLGQNVAKNYSLEFYWDIAINDDTSGIDCTLFRQYYNSSINYTALMYNSDPVYYWESPNQNIPTGWTGEEAKTIRIEGGAAATDQNFINWIIANATQITETVDYTPQLELIVITNQYVNSNNNYWNIKENVAIGIKLLNAEIYTPVNDVIELNMDILWNGSNPNVENVYLSEKLKFQSWQNTNEYITILSIERNEKSEQFTRILIYDEDSTQHYEIPKSGAQLSINALLQNTYYIRDLGSDYYTIRYRQGYNDGMETDQTLLSVIWGTMQIPFNIIFGTYNNTTHTYDGGLFNFTILGINVRAFTLGLMSMAIILAIVKLILGNK